MTRRGLPATRWCSRYKNLLRYQSQRGSRYVRHVSSALEIRFVEKWLVEIAESRYIRMLYILLSLCFFLICNLYL